MYASSVKLEEFLMTSWEMSVWSYLIIMPVRSKAVVFVRHPQHANCAFKPMN